MTDQTPVRVALLNDYPVVVQGLSAMLEPYRDRVEIVDVTVDNQVGGPIDVALYDDTFGVSSEDAHWSAHVGANWTLTYVVAYCWKTPPSRDERPVGTRWMIEVPKSLEGAALVEVLEQIRDTGDYEATTSADPVRDIAPVRRWPGQEQGLTERESEILSLIVTGVSNEELARTLFIGVNTVKTYIRSAYRTMGVSDRPNAILWGIDHGFRPQRPTF